VSAPEPPTGEASPNGAEASARGTDPSAHDGESGQPRYEPTPSVGKLLIWVLLFVLAAVVVVLGGVYFT
jgi:hypothetical protein